jgi:ethanolamine utilization protein EutQ
VSRRVHTADDVLRHARTGAMELVVAPEDLLTPLARDVANEPGQGGVGRPDGAGRADSAEEAGPDRRPGPPLKHVKGDTMASRLSRST